MVIATRQQNILNVCQSDYLSATVNSRQISQKPTKLDYLSVVIKSDLVPATWGSATHMEAVD